MIEQARRCLAWAHDQARTVVPGAENMTEDQVRVRVRGRVNFRVRVRARVRVRVLVRVRVRAIVSVRGLSLPGHTAEVGG